VGGAFIETDWYRVTKCSTGAVKLARSGRGRGGDRESV